MSQNFAERSQFLRLRLVFRPKIWTFQRNFVTHHHTNHIPSGATLKLLFVKGLILDESRDKLLKILASGKFISHDTQDTILSYPYIVN